MKGIGKIIGVALVLLLSIEMVLAQILAEAGSTLWGFLISPSVVFIFTVIFLFTLFSGIFLVALKKIPAFEDSNKVNIIAISLGAISTIPLVFLAKGGIVGFLTTILGPFSWFAALALAFLIFGLIYYGAEGEHCRHGMAFLAAGLAMIFFSLLKTNPVMNAWGWVIAIIGAIWLITCSFSGHGHDTHGYHGGGHHGGGHHRGHEHDPHDGDHEDHDPHDPENPDVPDPEEPDEPDEPENPPDFTNQLDQIEQLLQQYRAAFENLRDRCNELLQQHHDWIQAGAYYGSGTDPVSPEQWQAVVDARTRLEEISTQIQDLHDQITSHAQYAQIPDDQRQRLTDLDNQRADLAREMQDFYNDFWIRYENGDPPAP
tara:strand:+ start:2081 stop:3196 length:1116 start_codon:yes stop_codon:yes gene_type:complete